METWWVFVLVVLRDNKEPVAAVVTVRQLRGESYVCGLCRVRFFGRRTSRSSTANSETLPMSRSCFSLRLSVDMPLSTPLSSASPFFFSFFTLQS